MDLESRQNELRQMQEELVKLNERVLREPDNMELRGKVRNLSSDIVKLSGELLLIRIRDLDKEYSNKEDIIFHFIDNDNQEADILLSSNDVNYERAYEQQRKLLELEYNYINRLPIHYNNSSINVSDENYTDFYKKVRADILSLDYFKTLRNGAHFKDEVLYNKHSTYEGKHFRTGKHFKKDENGENVKSTNENGVRFINDMPFVEFIKDGYGYIVGDFSEKFLSDNYDSLNLKCLNENIIGLKLINNLSNVEKHVDGLDGVTVRVLDNGNIEVKGEVQNLEKHNFKEEKTDILLEDIYEKIKENNKILDKEFLDKAIDECFKSSDDKKINEDVREKIYVMICNKWIFNMANLDVNNIGISKSKSLKDYELIKDFCVNIDEVHSMEDVFKLYEKLNGILLKENSDFHKGLIDENNRYGYKADALYRYFGLNNVRLDTNGKAHLDRENVSNIYINKFNFNTYSGVINNNDYSLSVQSSVEGISPLLRDYMAYCEKNGIDYNINVDLKNALVTFNVSKSDLISNINLLNGLISHNSTYALKNSGNINDYIDIQSYGNFKLDDILKTAGQRLVNNYMKAGGFTSKEAALADMKKNDADYLKKYLKEIKLECDRNNIDYNTLCFKKGTLEEFKDLDLKKDGRGLDIIPDDYLNRVKSDSNKDEKVKPVLPVKRKVVRKSPKPTLKERWKKLSKGKKALIVAGIIAIVGTGVFVVGPQIMAGINAILNTADTSVATDTVNQTLGVVNDTVVNGPSLDYASIGDGQTVFANAYDAASNVNGVAANEWFNSNPVDVFNTATNSYMGLTPEQLNDPAFMAELAKDPNNALLLGDSMTDASGFVGLDEVVKGITR